MIRKPRKKFGGALGEAFDELWEAVEAGQIVESDSMTVDKTTRGTVVRARENIAPPLVIDENYFVGTPIITHAFNETDPFDATSVFPSNRRRLILEGLADESTEVVADSNVAFRIRIIAVQPIESVAIYDDTGMFAVSYEMLPFPQNYRGVNLFDYGNPFRVAILVGQMPIADEKMSVLFCDSWHPAYYSNPLPDVNGQSILSFYGGDFPLLFRLSTIA